MSSELRSIVNIAYRDIARFWRYKYWLAGQVAMNLADILIFGLIFNGVVNKDLIPDYVRFVTPGILCLSIFISSFSIGREVGVELRREVTQYLLTLPVRREGLIIGRLLGGAARGLVYQFGFLVFASIILSPPSLEGWVYVLATSSTLALTMSSVSISLSTVTRDFNLQATVRSLTYYILFFVSNIFYPQKVIAARLGPLAPVVDYSPLTMATNIYRWAFRYDASINPWGNFAGLGAWSLVIVALAYKLYIRNLLRD
ncbi:MAG: ABC transporter permease [Thermosphaera sp.]